jgi:hypothetical protein
VVCLVIGGVGTAIQGRRWQGRRTKAQPNPAARTRTQPAAALAGVTRRTNCETDH